MKKNMAFEKWVADQLMTGMVMMEPYGYREEKPGKYLHIFRIMLKFDDVSEPFEGVAFIPIPYDNNDELRPDFSAEEKGLEFMDGFSWDDQLWNS